MMETMCSSRCKTLARASIWRKLDCLFQSFYTTKPDGIGMGLAISRSIAEAHAGRLSAAPNQPRRAVFRFTLPVEEQSSAGAPNHPVVSRY